MGKVACCAAIIDAEKRILLLQRSLSSKNFPGAWTFPSGGIEPGDDSVATAVIREVKEETNLDFTITGKFKFYDGITNNTRYVVLVHLGTYSGELQHDYESMDARFFSYQETMHLETAFSYRQVLDDLCQANLIA